MRLSRVGLGAVAAIVSGRHGVLRPVHPRRAVPQRDAGGACAASRGSRGDPCAAAVVRACPRPARFQRLLGAVLGAGGVGQRRHRAQGTQGDLRVHGQVHGPQLAERALDLSRDGEQQPHRGERRSRVRDDELDRRADGGRYRVPALQVPRPLQGHVRPREGAVAVPAPGSLHGRARAEVGTSEPASSRFARHCRACVVRGLRA